MAFVCELPYKTTTAENKVVGAILGDWQTKSNGVVPIPSNLSRCTADAEEGRSERGPHQRKISASIRSDSS